MRSNVLIVCGDQECVSAERMACSGFMPSFKVQHLMNTPLLPLFRSSETARRPVRRIESGVGTGAGNKKKKWRNTAMTFRGIGAAV